MSASSPNEPSRQQHRIAKLLARAGIASRREVERMIAEGRVALDGQVLTTPAITLTSLNGVTVDGEAVAAAAPARLFRFHKPTGVLTTERDPRGRPTIYSRLPPGLPRLVPVGRLDLNTEGLLLMTTDGELKRQLELPATGVERSYRARAYGQVSQEQLEDLMLGTEIDGVRYGPIDANLERRTGANVWIELTLTEGKNREVRRVLEHLGLKVSRLIRTRYGPFRLDDMPVAAADEVRQHDLILFRKALAGPGGGKAASNLQLSGKPKAERVAVTEAAPVEETTPSNRADRRKVAAKTTGTARPARPERTSGRPPAKAVAAKPEAKPHRPEAKPKAGPKGWGANRKPRPAPARDDDAGELIDRPKRRYRSGDRRPLAKGPPKGPRSPRK
ncbi:pseudouridine synthase [Sphingomonas sp. MG17]|uniref:Pseudouridine synthase n=1 Tax=Sphingomonas tagetis TaxID=2949092 RepID=A0A9X2KMN9_9SPHN|nr:pseudouridine synthase [Sphingomonas tagetis]MCP3728863.1 pseudouridine synthase [Sphingomonas tagetis]